MLLPRSPAHRLVLAAFLMDFAIGLAGLAFIELAIHLRATPTVLGLIGTVGAGAYTLGCLVSGPLSDRYGRRRSVVASCLVVAAAWACYGLVRQPWQILLILPFSGGGMAFFWPPLQAWLAELSATAGDGALNRHIGQFNVAWCLGLLAGPVVCGHLWAHNQQAPFLLAVATSLGLVWLTATTPRGQALRLPTAPATTAGHPAAALYLTLARLGNFAGFVGLALVKTFFPDLAETLGLGPALVGWLIAALHGGQLLLFWLGGRSRRWHYRAAPLLLAPLLAAAGLLLAWASSTPWLFALGFGCAGVCAGITYLGSLYYSLHGNTADPGGKAGLHEAILGSGGLIGPLLGGALAHATTLRAPYLLGVGTYLAALLLMALIWRRGRRR